MGTGNSSRSFRQSGPVASALSAVLSKCSGSWRASMFASQLDLRMAKQPFTLSGVPLRRENQSSCDRWTTVIDSVSAAKYLWMKHPQAGLAEPLHQQEAVVPALYLEIWDRLDELRQARVAVIARCEARHCLGALA